MTKLFTRRRKLNVSLVFITQLYFKVPKDVRINSTHFFIMKIPNKREIQKRKKGKNISSKYGQKPVDSAKKNQPQM